MLSLLIEWWSQLVTGDSPWRQVTHHKETSLQKGTVAVHKLPCKEMCGFFRNSDDISTEILLIAFLTQAQTENSTFHIVTRHYFFFFKGTVWTGIELEETMNHHGTQWVIPCDSEWPLPLLRAWGDKKKNETCWRQQQLSCGRGGFCLACDHGEKNIAPQSNKDGSQKYPGISFFSTPSSLTSTHHPPQPKKPFGVQTTSQSSGQSKGREKQICS